jgi:hypothetical protein
LFSKSTDGLHPILLCQDHPPNLTRWHKQVFSFPKISHQLPSFGGRNATRAVLTHDVSFSSFGFAAQIELGFDQLMRSWVQYIDELGLPVGRYADGRMDGGDSSQRVGMIGIALATPNKCEPMDLFQTAFSFTEAAALNEIEPGKLVRHRTKSSDIHDMSRDNQRPLTQAIILWSSVSSEMKEEFLRIFKVHSENHFRYQSKDIATLSVMADYSRAIKTLPQSLIYLGDIDLLIGSMIQVVRSWIKKSDVDLTLNTVCSMRFNQLTIQTIFSRVAHFLFTGLVYKGVQWQFDEYFQEQKLNSPYSTSPPINELWRTIIKEDFHKWSWPSTQPK